MPRDDLSIDVNMPPQVEQQDPAGVLEEWINRVANMPNEIAFMQEEIEHKDTLMLDCTKVIKSHDKKIQDWIKANGSGVPNPKEDGMRKIIQENYDRVEILSAEKIALAAKTQQIIDKHVRNLDVHIKALQDSGIVDFGPELPSLLKPQNQNPLLNTARAEAAAQLPLSNNPNSATIMHTRQPNQYPQKAPAIAQIRQSSGLPTQHSAPATPAAAALQNRQAHAREASLGPTSKRQKTGPGGLGTLPGPSGLARHSSMTPSTQRAGTPVSRAGSAGPRSSQKATAHKKVAPSGSRQSGNLRKAGKMLKTGSSRLKRANKNSPPSTVDSDADSGSGDEEDEAVTPSVDRGDDDVLDDDEGSDDKKYCICHNVSHGDMVACDNDSCPNEWFHWECVGLKSEPIGTWICPDCTKNMKK